MTVTVTQVLFLKTWEIPPNLENTSVHKDKDKYNFSSIFSLPFLVDCVLVTFFSLQNLEIAADWFYFQNVTFSVKGSNQQTL
jgi:hypothetical protein